MKHSPFPDEPREGVWYVNQIRRGAEAMVKVYCYSKCTTCRKALKWLDDNKIEYEKLDIKEEHPNDETLRQLHKKSGLPLKRFFNTSGQLYREMELSKKLPNMSEDEMFRLLASDGMLVKRPLLITSDKVLTGFKEETWGEIFIADRNRR